MISGRENPGILVSWEDTNFTSLEFESSFGIIMYILSLVQTSMIISTFQPVYIPLLVTHIATFEWMI